MSGMQFNTDFSGIAPSAPGGGALPPTTDKMGWLVQIQDSDPRETKAKDGMMCVLKLEILEGPFKGTVGEHRINVANPSTEAVRIGMAEMSAIAHVTGTLRVGNSIELHNKPFRILVRKQADTNYTEVYGILDANGNEAGKAGQGPMQGQPAGGFGGQQQNNQGGGFGAGQGTPQGGFSPTTGQQQNPQQNPQQNNGGGGSPGWNNQPDPNQQQNNQQQNPTTNQQQQPSGNANGWSGGGGGGGGGAAPGWAAGNG